MLEIIGLFVLAIIVTLGMRQRRSKLPPFSF